MKLELDSDPESKPYIRSDVSIAVGISFLTGIVFAFVYHWTFFTIIVAVSYMGVGLSTVYEWNKALRLEGKVPQGVFANIRTAAFVPILLLVISFHMQGHPFLLNGTAMLLLLILYLYSLYAVGFRGLDSEEVHFKKDPYTGESFVWDSETYIPLLEQYSMEQSKNKSE